MLALPFSSLTSWPRVKFTTFEGSPEEPVVNAVIEEPESVFIVRLTAHVGVVCVGGGLLPLRIPSATEPFCTSGPSGESDHWLNLLVVQPLTEEGFVGTSDQ